jgi:hypothetical protein
LLTGRSTDRTVEIAQELGAETLLHKGMEKGDVIATALSHTKGIKNMLHLMAPITHIPQSICQK